MEFVVHLGILVSIVSILGLSLNLLVGYTGLLSVAHAAFYGVGAYTSALLMRHTEMNFFVTVFIGAALAAVLAYAVGLVMSKFRGDYYALASLGFNTIVFAILLNWQDVTRGPLGIPGISRPDLFGVKFADNAQFLFLAALITVGMYFLAKYITTSSFGRVLMAIREDEEALQVFGYKALNYKLTIFVISAAMASIAGSLYAPFISFIDPHAFAVFESIMFLTVVVVGGLANHKGSILGAVIVMLLPEALRFVGFPPELAGQMRQVLYGFILVLLMLYRPQGILGTYKL